MIASQRQFSGTIEVLEAGRGLAALAVLFFHCWSTTETFIVTVPQPFRYLFSQGYLGVDFFFVLSGFIIYWTAAGLERTPAAASDFLFRRLVRIFVPYWPIGLAMAAAYVLLPGLTGVDRSWSWPATLFLLPSGAGPPALDVAWTLQHELLFYGLFALFFVLGGVRTGMLVWANVIAIVWLVGTDQGWLGQFVLNPINLEFAFGIFAAVLVGRARSVPDWPCWTIAVVAAGLFFIADQSRVVLGFGIAAALVPLCRLEIGGRLGVAPALVQLGAASYALYLIHTPLVSLTTRLAAGFSFDWPVSIALGAAVCLAAGLAYHFAYERPALRFVRRLSGAGRVVPT